MLSVIVYVIVSVSSFSESLTAVTVKSTLLCPAGIVTVPLPVKVASVPLVVEKPAELDTT